MKKLFSYFFIFILAACSSGQRDTRMSVRESFSKQDYEKALKVLDSNKLKDDETLALLRSMEKANIRLAQNYYFQATKEFENAIEISRKLYTEKVSKIATSAITNDNFTDFYGEKFERSMLYFLSSLSYISLAQKGKRENYVLLENNGKDVIEKIFPEAELKPDELRLAKMASRATILAWDSFQNNLKNDNFGKKVFKQDLLAKIYGAYIHESMQSNTDDQIALQLYKDAKDVLYKYYNIYPAFNTKASLFQDNFEKLSSLQSSEVNQMIDQTSFSADLYNYLDNKIKSLTKKEKKPNVKIVIQEGMIADKVGIPVNIGLKGATEGIENPNTRAAVKAVGEFVLTAFAANTLGLVGQSQSLQDNYLGTQVARLGVNEAAIEFEVPKVLDKPIQRKFEVLIKDKQGNLLDSKPVFLVSPLSDIARESVKEEAMRRYFKTGMRVAAKHLAAIATSYATYKLIKDKSGELFAKAAAIAQYIGASKLISASEKADSRYYSTLPHTIRLVDFDLRPGEYLLALKIIEGDQSTQVELPTVVVKNSDEIQIIQQRVF